MEATAAGWAPRDTRTTLLGDEMIRICSTSTLHHRRPNRTPACNPASQSSAVAPRQACQSHSWLGLSPKRRQNQSSDRRSPAIREAGCERIVALWRKRRWRLHMSDGCKQEQGPHDTHPVSIEIGDRIIPNSRYGRQH